MTKETDEKIFEGIPKISEDVIRTMTKFEPYLFFRTEKRGLRHYYCSACGEEFDEGERVLRMLMTSEDYALAHAAHNSICRCPKCGESCTVKNEKIIDMTNFNHERFVVVFIPVAYDDVWIRCFQFGVDNAAKKRPEFREWFRYRLRPGKPEAWMKWDCSREWMRLNRFKEPFRWADGCYHEEYDYWSVCNDLSQTKDGLKDTFLRFSGFDVLRTKSAIPEIPFLCYYSLHPQLEILAKMGYRGLIWSVIEGKEMRRDIDWNAKKPWDFFRLPREVFNALTANGAREPDMDVVKTFHRIKGKKISDIETANKLLHYFNRYNTYGTGIQPVFHAIALAKTFRADPKDLIRYIDRQMEISAPGCHLCYGPTRSEMAETWFDYLEMAETLKGGNRKAVNPFPKDLKAEHDKLASQKKKLDELNRIRDEKERARKKRETFRAEAKREAPELEKKYPTVAKVYAKIRDKYAYNGEKFSIVVPNGIEDLLFEGKMLSHCIARVDRYYDRIKTNESYLLFLRKTEEPDEPYYTLEVEPGGAVRQKRTFFDQQNDDIKEATDFLREWQTVVQKRLTAADRKKAKRAVILRNENFKELRENKTIVRTGFLTGKLLADVLEADLLDVEFVDTNRNEKELKKA